MLHLLLITLLFYLVYKALCVKKLIKRIETLEKRLDKLEKQASKLRRDTLGM